MEILKLIGIFLIQPGLWMGLLMTFINYSLRIKSERRNFRIALNKDFYEIRHFIKTGLGWGILCSLISLMIGIYLPSKLIIVYEIVAVLAMLVIRRIDLSILPLFVIGIIAAIYQLNILPVILILMMVSYFVKNRLIRKQAMIWMSPEVITNRHQRKAAEYRWSEFTVLPFLMYIPGDWFEKILNIFPLFHFGPTRLSFFILPLFIGSCGRIKRYEFEKRFARERGQNNLMMLITLGCTLLAWILPRFDILWIAVMVASQIGIKLYQFLQLRQIRHRYIEVNNGIRVIAIRPNTPAAKMNLDPGDVILTCNGIQVNNEQEFYDALQTDSAYCHLKVRTLSGDLKITESAIYNDSPHELGVVQFQTKF